MAPLFSILLLGILVFVVIRVSLHMFSQIYPALHFGAIYVPSSPEKMEIMMHLAQIAKGERVIDLGSGDGRLVIAAAQRQAYAVGVELNKKMNTIARKRIKKMHLEDRAIIRQENMWKTNVSEFDVVFVYGIPYIMKKLEKKLLRQLTPGARIVSNNYQFPTLTPQKEKENVRLYIVP